MTDGPETFIVMVTDAQGRGLFTGSFQAATYHRALRIAWSETTDDRPVRSAVALEPPPMPVAGSAAPPCQSQPIPPFPCQCSRSSHDLLRLR